MPIEIRIILGLALVLLLLQFCPVAIDYCGKVVEACHRFVALWRNDREPPSPIAPKSPPTNAQPEKGRN